MAEEGYARFSAREVAKRIGYSVGTIYNLFGSNDALVLAINTQTFELWSAHLRAALAGAGDDRIGALVTAYFVFAQGNPNLWMAIYDHRLPPSMAMPDEDVGIRAKLTGIVDAEIASELECEVDDAVTALSRSLIAVVHGHCAFALTGSFALMGEDDPIAAALARVRESLMAARSGSRR
jgi:AcrR family transcriptional regulator